MTYYNSLSDLVSVIGADIYTYNMNNTQYLPITFGKEAPETQIVPSGTLLPDC